MTPTQQTAVALLYAQIRSEIDAKRETDNEYTAHTPSTLKHKSRRDRTKSVAAKMLPGEITPKEFLKKESKRIGCSVENIWYHIRAGKYPHIEIRRVTRSAVFFKVGKCKTSFMPPRCGPKNKSGIDRKEIGHTAYMREVRKKGNQCKT
jgi:hypothetical protein